ncbi:MAG: PadR family transcriptional regulator [Candidatus Diapherotrites archaeon]|nr:PadR family transcriptional regulator [Candidatus Diapherotrites archaeon]
MRPEQSPEMKRLERKLGVELLWVFVLALIQKQPNHAYAIRRKIEQEFGFLPGNVSAYVVLYKLESRGFVKTHPDANKIVYSITADGRKLLTNAKKQLQQKIDLLN